jgi:hypothetical protein
MQKVLFFILLWLPVALNAQTISNGGLESWQVIPYETPDGWMNSNDEFGVDYGVFNVTKINPAVTNSGIRLQTVSAGPNPDTLLAFISNSEDPFSGDGGYPFTQKPTTLSGNFRYNIMSGDMAYIFVIFKKNGTVYSVDTIKITGNAPTFVFNNYTLTHITASSIIPDTVIFAAVSSNFDGLMLPGSTLEMDNLNLTGPSVTQTMNGTFDNWTSKSVDLLADWELSGDATRTTDKYSGTYAAKLVSHDDGFGNINYADMQTNITLGSTIDTLTGWYKYSNNGDSASVVMIIFDNNGNFLDARSIGLGPQASYTRFKVPFDNMPTGADNILLILSSSSFMNEMDGSTLFVDSLSILKEFVGVHEIAGGGKISVYPNPATDVLNIQLSKAENKTSVVLYDVRGSVAFKNEYTVLNGKNISVPVTQLTKGLYICEIKTGNTIIREKFVKE